MAGTRVDAIISVMKSDPRWWGYEDDARRVAAKTAALFPNENDKQLSHLVFRAFGFPATALSSHQGNCK